MSTEIGRLVAVFDADTKRFDRGLVGVEKGVKNVTGVMGNLGLGVKGLDGALGGLGSRMTGIGTIASQLGGSMSLLSAGMGTMASVGIGLGVTMFKMAKSAAEAGDEIFDLTQKINFSAESISTLKNEGELAGVEFGAISVSLGIFNKNLDAAQSGNKALAATFKGLKIDLSSNEVALRSAFKALMAVEDGGQQAALAMKIFGRSGKEILGVIHSLGGDIDAATAKFRDMNTLITTESARAGNEFSDKLKILEQRFDGVTRAIGIRFMPTAMDALEKVSQALDDNSHHAQTWADGLVSAASFAAAQMKHELEGLSIVVRGFQKTFGEGSFFGDMIKGETRDRFLAMPDGQIMNLRTREMMNFPGNRDPEGEFAIAGGAGSGSVGAGHGSASGPKKDGRLDFEDTPTRSRPSRPPADPGLALLRQLQSELQKLTIATRTEEVAQQLLGKEFTRTSTAIKQQIQLAAVQIDLTEARKKNAKATEAEITDLSRFVRLQTETLNEFKFGPKSALDEANEFIQTFPNVSRAMDENQKHWLRFNATLIHVQERIKSLRVDLENIAEGTPAIASNGIPDVGKNVLTESQLAAMGEPPPALRDTSEMRARMKDLGFELTGIVSRSFEDGIRIGGLQGLALFGQRLLEVVERNFLDKIASGLGDLLGGAASGGGFWGGLLKTLGFSAIGGAAGGLGSTALSGFTLSGNTGFSGAHEIGHGFAGSFASGGLIRPGEWGVVHDNEQVHVGPRGAQVIPSSVNNTNKKTEIHFHNTFQIAPTAGQSHNPKHSTRQQAEMIASLLYAQLGK